ncbi:MAG: hypothetical protein B6I28_02970 [Fusobacteriia bacterium 4572_132]|nr:MAG: hypothetical protein B6I28_02970 [Fusobacteriia bacterium 4572_132]
MNRRCVETGAILYITRWLKAGVKMPDGSNELREKGTPQGGVISPLLANLFLHYALDKWLENKFTKVEYERFADDTVLHY